jgi:hypothetical protein
MLVDVVADKDADKVVAAVAEAVTAAARLLYPVFAIFFKGNTEEMNGLVFQCFN